MTALCRICGIPVALSSEAEDRLQTFNRILVRREEEPLDPRREVAECQPCYRKKKQAEEKLVRQEIIDGYLLLRDLKSGELLVPDGMIWGHHRVRAVMEGGLGPQMKEMIKEWLRSKKQKGSPGGEKIT